MKKNYSTIDILKGLAILAVVGIHFLDKTFPYLSESQKLWGFWLDQGLRFSVPLFVALSGYGLAQKYQSQTLNYRSFLKRRAIKLLPAYFLGSAIAYGSIIFFRVWPGYRESYPWWQIIFLGRADYHLYFVPMIFQLYLLFPFFWQATQKFSLKFLLLTWGFQLGWFELAGHYLQPFKNGFWSDQWQYLLGLTWVGYFVLGIFLATQKILSWKLLKLLGAGALLLGLIFSGLSSWQLFVRFGDTLQAVRFNRPVIFLYASGFIVFSLSLGAQFFKPSWLWRPIEILGRWSYEIYLIHTLPLRFLIDVKHFSPLYYPEIQYLLILLFSSSFAGLIHWLSSLKLMLFKNSFSQTPTKVKSTQNL